MSRIKLRTLLNLTEQAQQAPLPSPVPAPVVPSTGGMDASTPEAPTPETPSPDTSPEPEDPSEYDFTRDFRAFEDKKNKAEADAKKILLDKMNKRLLNKTVVANASRGYGQPKTDYTIKNLKKVSVEFWYKDYVVIVTDENDKKYFLTPGINIKIENGGSEPAPVGQERPTTGQEAPSGPSVGGDAEETPQGVGVPPAGGEESPNLPQIQAASVGAPESEPQASKVSQPAPQTSAPNTQPQQQPQKPEEPQAQQPPLPVKKKKKLAPVSEWIQKDLNTFLLEFMSDKVKDENGKVDFLSYVKETTKMLAESKDATRVRCKLLIPESHMINFVENREIKLAAVDSMRQKTYYGQYSKGSVDITKHGRYYLLEYVKEVGWNI